MREVEEPAQVTDAGFEAFVAARWHALYRTAYLLTGSRADAEDLLQTALTGTFSHRRRIRHAEATESYVRTAMARHAARGWRRRGREVVLEVLPEVGHDGGLAGHDERDVLWQAVRALPPRMRAALVLRYYEDLSEAATAEVLGCSVGTVKSTTHRAIARLRADLGDRADVLGGTR